VELASSLGDGQSDFELVLFVKEPQLGWKGSRRPKGWCWQWRVERELEFVTSRQALKALLAGQKTLSQLRGIQPDSFGLSLTPCMLL
jgi:hypothetical protein